ncbi:hypothetical protein VVR12_01835 [Rothia sp. LK2588]|uniref:hypothetical protein n=1 Tax=Rothia sp. LK2588 TaxID=3114369 RepID=UPI0034CF67CB
MSTFALYFIRTTTGEVGSRVDPLSLSWSIALNKSDSISATIPKEKLRKTDKLWWHPWSGGLLVTFTDHQGFERPLAAGPITDWGTEDGHSLQVSASGIRTIFEKRTVWENLSYTGLSLGSIAWRLVQHGMDKPGGGLPIVHGAPDESGIHQRTYERWNLANNAVEKRLTELSEVINGPDIMFRPRWKDDSHRQIVWDFVHGTNLDPYIAQSWTPDFDTTTALSDIAGVDITSTGKHLVNRVWYTGAGEGEGVARDYAENLKAVEEGSPFLEKVESDADQADASVLKSKAQGDLTASTEMLDQVTLKVSTTSTKNPLGSFYVGDLARVTLDGWLSVPDGTRDMRIIKMAGSTSHEITLDFQEDSW